MNQNVTISDVVVNTWLQLNRQTQCYDMVYEVPKVPCKNKIIRYPLTTNDFKLADEKFNHVLNLSEIDKIHLRSQVIKDIVKNAEGIPVSEIEKGEFMIYLPGIEKHIL